MEGIPMGDSWLTHGLSLRVPRGSQRKPMEAFETHWSAMEGQWKTHGSTANPREPRGSPMDQHCKPLVVVWEINGKSTDIEVPW